MRNDGRGRVFEPGRGDDITNLLHFTRKTIAGPAKRFAKFCRARPTVSKPFVRSLLNNRLRARVFLLVIGKLNTMLPPCAIVPPRWKTITNYHLCIPTKVHFFAPSSLPLASTTPI